MELTKITIAQNTNRVRKINTDVIMAIDAVNHLQLGKRKAKRAITPYPIANTAACETANRLLLDGSVTSHNNIKVVIPPGIKKPIRNRPRANK